MTPTRKKRTRLTPMARRQQLLNVALILAEKIGYQKVSQYTIAKYLGISLNLTIYHFNNMSELRHAIMRAAIERKIIPIIAQGIGAQDVHAHKAPDDLKKQAIEFLTK